MTKKQKYVNEYAKNHYDRLTLLLPKGQKQEAQSIAKDLGISTTQLYQQALKYCVDNGIYLSFGQ